MSYGWRPHIESALRLSISDLKRAGALRIDRPSWGSWQWSRDGEPFASISYRVTLLDEWEGDVTLTYSTTDRHGESRSHSYDVPLRSSPMRFGGVRWWFLCPYTGKRVWKLYKFGSVDKFCARTAIRPLPTYACQRGSRMEAIQIRRTKIRRRLNCGAEHDDPLYKPKWMRHATFDRWCDLDAALAEKEDTAFLGRLGRLLARIDGRVSQGI